MDSQDINIIARWQHKQRGYLDIIFIISHHFFTIFYENTKPYMCGAVGREDTIVQYEDIYI